MVEIQLLLVIEFIFVLLSLDPHSTSIFLTSLYTMLRQHPLLCMHILFIHRIILQKHKLNGEGNLTGLLYITVTEGCIMEIFASIEPFCFSIYAITWTRSSTLRLVLLWNSCWITTWSLLMSLLLSFHKCMSILVVCFIHP